MGGKGVDASSEHQGQTQMGLREFEWKQRLFGFVQEGQADSTVERYLLSRFGRQAVIRWLAPRSLSR
jgi:6-phosphofructokinase